MKESHNRGVLRILREEVFPVVRTAGYLARGSLASPGCSCHTCTHDLADKLAVKAGALGYIFTRAHEVRRFVKKPEVGLLIFFGEAGDTTNDKIRRRVATTTVKACKKAGLKVEWNGSLDRAIIISQ